MKKFTKLILQALAVLLFCFGIISTQNLSMVVEAAGCQGYCPCGPMNCATNACDWGYVSSNGNSFVSNGSCQGHQTYLGPVTEVGRSSSVSSYDSNGIRYYTRTTTIVYNVTLHCHLCSNTAPRTTYVNSYDRWSETIIPAQTLILRMNKPSGMSSSVSKSDQTLTNGIQYYTKSGNDVSAYVPSATGWTFNGFYLQSNGGTKIYDGAGKNVAASGYWTDKYPSGYLSYKTQSALTVYGNWSPNTYTIVYNLNGGSYGSSHPSTGTYDTAFTVNAPTRAGYTFKGWKIEGMDSVTHTYGSSTTTATSIGSTTATSFKNLRSTSGTVTFSAIWEGINVKLYGNGNKPSNMSSTIYNGGSSTTFNSTTSQAIKDMSPYQQGYFTNITTLSATGWTFNGWYYNGSTLLYNSSGVPQKNVPSNNKIFVDYDFYSYGTSSNATTGNVNYTITTNTSKQNYATVHLYSETGDHPGCGGTVDYNAAAWHCPGCGAYYGHMHYYSKCRKCGVGSSSSPLSGTSYHCTTGSSSSTTKTAGTITITRSGNTLTASYADNGSNANNISSVSYVWKNASGTQVGTGNSYTFTASGTYSVTISGTCESATATGSASIGVTYTKTPATVFTQSSAVSIYASWTANTYSITYDLAGGTYGSSHPTSATYDTAFTVDNPTRGGYKFKGWTITEMDSVTHTYDSKTSTATSLSSITATSFKNLRSTSGTVKFTAVWEQAKFNLFVSSGRPSNMDPTVNIMFKYNGSDFAIPNDNNYYSINDFNWKETGGTYTYTYADGSKVQLPNMTQVIMNLEYGKNVLNNIGYLYADGYTFNGWKNKDDGKSVYKSTGAYDSSNTAVWNSSGNFVGNKDLYVYCSWSPISYSVSYALDGGSWEGAAPVSSVAFGSDFFVGQPTRKGYTFAGWDITGYQTKYASSNSGLHSASTWVNSTDDMYRNLRFQSGTVTFTAKWEPLTTKVTLNYNKPNSMTATLPANQSFTATYDSRNYSDIASCNPAPLGWDFKGWYTAETGGVQVYDANGYALKGTYWSDTYANSGVWKYIGSTLTLYAQYTAHTYKISYDLNDISSLSDPAYGTNHPTTVTYDNVFQVDNPTMTGYTFKGWAISGMDSNTHKYGSTNSVTSSSTANSLAYTTVGTSNIYFKNLTATNNGTVTFKAMWEPVKTTVTFNYNKGSYSSMTSSVPSNTSKTMTYDTTDNNDIGSITPSVVGWKFLGWYTSATGGTQVYTADGKNNACTHWSAAYSSGKWKTTSSSVTLYAHYEPITYKIKYELNGGTVSGTNPTTATYDTQFNVNNQPTLEGAVFVGWDITGFNTSTAKYGTSNTSQTTTPWRTTQTVFKNLNPTQNAEVTFTARYKDAKIDNPPNPNSSTLDQTLTVKTESGLNYTYDTWTAETVILTYSAKDLSGITKVYLKDNTGTPYNEQTNLAPQVWGKATISYTTTGIYNGTLYAEDKAATATNNGLVPQPSNNHVEGNYGPIKVDKTKPEASVSYNPASSVGYNGDVVITVTASDAHSGLADTAYRWSYLNSNGTYTTGSWVNSNTQTVYYNRSGYVEIRDKVGNIQKVNFKVDWIDKQSAYANVTAVGTSIDGNSVISTIDLNGQNKVTTGPLSVEYINAIYESGLKMNAWSVTDVTLRLSMLDKDYNNGQLKASGFGSITALDIFRQYASGSYSTASSKTLTSAGNISNSPATGYTGYTYTIGEGYHWINAAFTDKAGITVKQTIGIKVDKTAPTINVEACKRNTPKLTDYSSAELLAMTGSGTFVDNFSTAFHFEINDKASVANAATGRYTEGSGIKSVILTVYDYNNPSIAKTYDLTSSPYMTVVGYCDTIEKGLYAANYDCAINTFKEFPSSSLLSYKLIATDNAGNVREATWEKAIVNFQIRADILSSVDDEYNTVEGKNIVAYFKTGDLGYVDIWTLGYVDSVQFDFGNIGSEAVQEIKDGNLLAKYNLGVKGVSGYDRVLPASIAQGYDLGFSKINGVSIVSRYVIPGEYLSDGTGIRIPLLLEIDDYMYCTADFIAKKNGDENKDAAEYYIYDNANTSLHWRVTHE